MANDLQILNNLSDKHKKAIGELFSSLGVTAPVSARNIYLVFANPKLGPRFTEGLLQITLPEASFEGENSGEGKKALIQILQGAGKILDKTGSLTKDIKILAGHGSGDDKSSAPQGEMPKVEEKKILGLAKPIFYTGLVLLIVIIGYVIYRQIKNAS